MTRPILYSTECPRCIVLKKKLKDKKIQYDEFTDEGKMLEMGIQSVPMLFTDGELLDFVHAVAWINEYEGD